MTQTRSRVVALAVALVGMFVLTPAAAQTSTEEGFYTLTLYAVKGNPTDAGSSLERLAKGTLLCGPDRGDHKNPGAACDDLRAANGFIDQVGETPGPCTSEYSPVYAVAEGRWKGATRVFGKVFPNRCHAVRSTGGDLFRI